MLVPFRLAFDAGGVKVKNEVCHLSSLFISSANQVSSMTSNHFDGKIQMTAEHLGNVPGVLKKQGFYEYLCVLSCIAGDDLTEIKQTVVENIINYLTSVIIRTDGDVIEYAYHVADTYCSSLMQVCGLRISNSSIKEIREVSSRVQREAKKYPNINYWFTPQIINNKNEKVKKPIKNDGQQNLFNLDRKVKTQREKIALVLRKSKSGITISVTLDQGGYSCVLLDEAVDQLKMIILSGIPDEIFADVDILFGGTIKLKEFYIKK